MSKTIVRDAMGRFTSTKLAAKASAKKATTPAPAKKTAPAKKAPKSAPPAKKTAPAKKTSK